MRDLPGVTVDAGRGGRDHDHGFGDRDERCGHPRETSLARRHARAGRRDGTRLRLVSPPFFGGHRKRCQVVQVRIVSTEMKAAGTKNAIQLNRRHVARCPMDSGILPSW